MLNGYLSMNLVFRVYLTHNLFSLVFLGNTSNMNNQNSPCFCKKLPSHCCTLHIFPSYCFFPILCIMPKKKKVPSPGELVETSTALTKVVEYMGLNSSTEEIHLHIFIKSYFFWDILFISVLCIYITRTAQYILYQAISIDNNKTIQKSIHFVNLFPYKLSNILQRKWRKHTKTLMDS